MTSIQPTTANQPYFKLLCKRLPSHNCKSAMPRVYCNFLQHSLHFKFKENYRSIYLMNQNNIFYIFKLDFKKRYIIIYHTCNWHYIFTLLDKSLLIPYMNMYTGITSFFVSPFCHNVLLFRNAFILV